MFKIVIFQVIVAVVVASPIYPGGMGYGGIGTSSVSVSRRTQVMTPGIGMMSPGMGMYGMGLGRLTDESAAPEAEKAEKGVEGKKETVTEKGAEVEAPVEVMKNIDNKAPMGQMKAGVMGAMGMGPGMMGTEAGSSRTDVMRSGMGGASRTSVGESHVATPFGSKSSVSSVSQRASGLL